MMPSAFRGGRSLGTTAPRVGGACALVALLSAGLGAVAGAQPEYRNIDGGRPVRIEDADASARHSLDFQISPVRVDRITGGVYRWQLEPRVSYAAFPRTELEVRAPFAYRERDVDPRGGLVGVGIGAFHTLRVETERMPALAAEAELLFSAGGSLTSGDTYSVRSIATRTFGRYRLHANAAYGTYRVPLPSPNDPANLPQIPDTPCSINTGEGGGASRGRVAAACSATSQLAMSSSQVDPGGSRWLVGAAVDRTFPLRSLLLVADVFAEDYRGLERPLDWTVEAGVRRQVALRTVLEASAGTRFTGPSPAWFVSFGVTTSRAARMLIPETRP
jgi:hypothetical protein